jgi:hypothetical protein
MKPGTPVSDRILLGYSYGLPQYSRHERNLAKGKSTFHPNDIPDMVQIFDFFQAAKSNWLSPQPQ